MKIIDTDILIVGGGIAGSALACGLRQAGYHITLVEQRKDKLDTARGDHLQICVVDLLAKWGVLDTFMARGSHRRVGHEFCLPNGEVILQMDYAAEAAATGINLPHPYFVVTPHDEIAEIFLDLAAENPNFVRLQPVNARKFQVEGDKLVSAQVTLPDGSSAEIRPRLVVGADGTNSVLRGAMGFTADEYQYTHPMVAMFGAPPAGMGRSDYFYRYGSPHGMLVIQPRRPDFIKVTTVVGKEGIGWWKKSSAQDRAAMLAQRCHLMADFVGEIGGFYPTKMIHVHDYAKSNVVLIGDAAHSIHPARGQGLNVGIGCLGTLISHLPAPDQLGDPALLHSQLQRYASYQRERYAKQFARNHDAALAMEASVGENAEAFVRQEDDMIRKLHSVPELRRIHFLDAIGYPFGLP